MDFKTKFPLLHRVFVTNWKTSLSGLLVVVALGGRVCKVLDREDMQYLMGIAVTAGLFAAKDGVRDETVVAPENVPETPPTND